MAIQSFQDSFRYVGATITGIIYGSALDAGDIESDSAVLSGAEEPGKRLAL